MAHEIPLAVFELQNRMTNAPSSETAFVEALVTTQPVALPATAPARWLLLALHRHTQRQAWVGHIVEEKLRSNCAEISRLGAFARHRVPNAGPVPEMDGWTYRFHGVGFCLTHRDGTCLDVDFVDGETDWVDPYFYLEFLEALPAPELVEARLIRPKPFSGHWQADLSVLRDTRLIDIGHRIRITEDGVKIAGVMEAGFRTIQQSNKPWYRAWAAINLGDAALAMELLNGEVPEALRQQVEGERRERSRWLIERLRSDFSTRSLQALAELGRDLAEPSVLKQLEREPVDGTVSTALDFIEFWSDERHASAVLDVLEHAKGDQAPAPFLRIRAAAITLRLTLPGTITNKARDQILSALSQPQQAGDGEAGFLIALLDLNRGIERLKSALKSELPLAREEAASALGLIGTKEAICELQRCETVEAKTIVSVLRGTKRVYNTDEIILDDTEEVTAETFGEFKRRFADLRNRWLPAEELPQNGVR